MRIWICSSLALGWIAGLAGMGCSHFGEESFTVVERSKEKKPRWLEMDLGVTLEDDRRFRYASENSGAVILANAIKDAQLQSIEQGSDSFTHALSIKLDKFTKTKSIVVVDRSVLMNIATRHFGSVYGERAKIADIYYEKLKSSKARPGSDSLYRVYVLVEFHKTHLPQLWHDLGTLLRRSTSKDLVAVGKALQVAKPNQLAH